MKIISETLVKTAVESSPRAQAIFERHGVNPLIACRSIYAKTTLAEAVDWCALEDLDELIEELNAALAE